MDNDIVQQFNDSEFESTVIEGRDKYGNYEERAFEYPYAYCVVRFRFYEDGAVRANIGDTAQALGLGKLHKELGNHDGWMRVGEVFDYER